jgi:hypothetical protein
MASSRHLPLCVFASLALLLAGSASAQAPDGEWASYRDAYRAMVVFEKYGRPKHLIQNHFQVMPKEKGVAMDGVRLSLTGKSTQLNLPLDATGRTVFPLLKAAYDENAALALNRRLSQFVLRPRVSLVVRPDGVYDAAELRAACDQALNFARYVDASARSLSCAGVRFGFAGKGAAPVVRVRSGEQLTVLQVVDGALFSDSPDDGFRTALYRFAGTQAQGQVVTQEAPLAIVPVFE